MQLLRNYRTASFCTSGTPHPPLVTCFLGDEANKDRELLKMVAEPCLKSAVQRVKMNGPFTDHQAPCPGRGGWVKNKLLAEETFGAGCVLNVMEGGRGGCWAG